MKTENTIGLVGLVAIIGLVAFFSARYDNLLDLSERNAGVLRNSATPLTNTSTVSSGIPITDIVVHSTAADCWIIIRAKVYNVTSYLTQHPGGASRITPYCGSDATTAFSTKGGEGTHSVIAENDLAKLYVGEVQGAPTTLPVTSNLNTNTTVQTNASTSAVKVNTPSTVSVLLDAATVAKHNRASDCWIIVNNGVYAVTGYLNKHPGGASRITPYCGRAATTAFATQGGSGSHSSGASADLAALRLGTLGSSTTTKTITQVNANVGTLNPQGGEREDEDDD